MDITKQLGSRGGGWWGEGEERRGDEGEREMENMKNLGAKFVHLQLIRFKCNSFLELL
jgi:hypothetical protein